MALLAGVVAGIVGVLLYWINLGLSHILINLISVSIGVSVALGVGGLLRGKKSKRDSAKKG
jgi:predicted RND superfamily exporter protein